MTDISFEPMTEEHLRPVLEMYNYYVTRTSVTFHVEPLSEREMRDIVFFDDEKHKAFVVKSGAELCGYIILAKHHERAAYDRTGDATIYLKPDCVGKGIGKRALQYLEQYAASQGFHALVAVICQENEKSIGLFKRCGYFQCAYYREVGEKFGRLLDVVCYEKILGQPAGCSNA